MTFLTANLGDLRHALFFQMLVRRGRRVDQIHQIPAPREARRLLFFHRLVAHLLPRLRVRDRRDARFQR